MFMMTAILAFSVLYFGYVLREVERTFDSNEAMTISNMDYLTDGWWLAVTTISSVGYGGWANTHLGRLILGTLTVIGIFYMSL
jgi:hypothetical protein